MSKQICHHFARHLQHLSSVQDIIRKVNVDRKGCDIFERRIMCWLMHLKYGVLLISRVLLVPLYR